MAKIFGWKKSNYQPDPNHERKIVDCPLYDMNTTPDVFWSESKNSYCLVEATTDGSSQSNRFCFEGGPTGHYLLASINGAGEIRWDVSKDRIDYMLEMEEKYGDDIGDSKEFLAALRHFGLAPLRCPKCKTLNMFHSLCLNICCDYRG